MSHPEKVDRAITLIRLSNGRSCIHPENRCCSYPDLSCSKCFENAIVELIAGDS